jgi:hypothetical protein
MDDRKCFGDFSDHSTDCSIGWNAALINDVKESAERGCNRCRIHSKALFSCASTSWLDDPDVVVSCLKDSRSPSLMLEAGAFQTTVQFFTADGKTAKSDNEHNAHETRCISCVVC